VQRRDLTDGTGKSRGLTSIIVPAYNEATVIQRSLARLTQVLEISVPNYEVIVVDDGSDDSTASLVAVIASDEPRVRLESYQPNKGKGHALRHGFSTAKGEVVVFFDGDLDIDPESVPVLIQQMEVGHYDVMVASKMHKDSQVVYPWTRRFTSRCFYLFVWLLLRIPVKDTQVGLKVFKGHVLDSVMHLPRVDGFAFDAELLALVHQAGFRIGEGPVQINYRNFSSYVGPSAIVRALADTIRVFFRMRERKRVR
jgi:glycosyltransferase involved in cell wall biosynthesis